MLNIPLIDIAMSFSGAIDMISPQMTNHHKRVAYIAQAISKEMELDDEETRQILLAGLLHDSGAIHDQEKLKTFRFDLGANISDRLDHCYKGWRLLRDSEDLRVAAEIIRFHHLYWSERNSSVAGDGAVRLGSHIINLADRIDVLVDRDEEILGQRTSIEETVRSNTGKMFMPDAVEAFMKLSSREYFWFDLNAPFLDDIIRKSMGGRIITVGIERLRSLAEIMNKIIDFRSSFTAVHSVGVAECAGALAAKLNFPEEEIQMMNIAGLLHDLGKLAVPAEILEKNGPLNQHEFNIMKKHTFYSYRIIERIPQMQTINEWASYHHERLNGGGYPFGLKEKDLSPGSRIMAISDIFTALTEARPYRAPMPISDALKIMDGMAVQRHLDGDILAVLKTHVEEIDQLKLNAQNSALQKNSEFLRAKAV